MTDESPLFRSLPTPPGPPPPPRPPTGGGRRRERPVSLARRIVPAAVILGSAGALLVALDHPGNAADASVGTDDATALGTGVASPSTTPSTTPAVTVAPGSSASPSTTVPETPTCSGTTSTLTGSTIQTKYGPVQVQATVDAGGDLCTVSALESPSTDRKSVAINQRAVPTLVQRTLAAGGTDFSGVSGATITSNAYKSSLQSILDQL